MKHLISTTCLLLCVVALVGSASAQRNIHFGPLPPAKVPEPMPAGYGGVDWDNFFYVNPYAWPAAGVGDKLGTENGDIVIIGSKDCRMAENFCFGKLNHAVGFTAVRVELAASFGPTQVVVSAYDHGRFLGWISIYASTVRRELTFPTSWGVATELDFQVSGPPDSLAIYSLEINTLD